MNAHSELHHQELLGIHQVSLVRRLITGCAILGLAAIGFLAAWEETYPFNLRAFLFALVVTLGPAAAYAYGYFGALPNVLGKKSDVPTGSLVVRWSEFARLTAAFSIVITWAAWGTIIAMHFQEMKISLVPTQSWVNLFILGTLTAHPGLCAAGALLAAALMAMCVVGSEEYLAQTIGNNIPTTATGWRAVVRRMVGKCGAWLNGHLRSQWALMLGAGLLLLSLFDDWEVFGGPGFDVVSGDIEWPTASYTLTGLALAILCSAGRWIYVAALSLALLAVVAVLLGRHGDRLRQSWVLRFLAMFMAVFAVCDLTLGLARLWHNVPRIVSVAAQGGIWILPIALWVWRARGDQRHWDQTRIATMIFYLPIGFVGLALAPVALALVPGYALFLYGVVCLAWGFRQSKIGKRPELAAPPVFC